MKKGKFFILLILVLIIGWIIFFTFFSSKTAKNLKVGNNSSSQEIVNAILNISSYEAIVEVKVHSNKNENHYILKQKYESEDKSEQEILEPENIAGMKILKNGKQLKIENTNLSLTTIFESYEYLSDNILDLSCFIQDYKEDEQASWTEKGDQIILSTKKEKEEKTLEIDKKEGNPINMKVKWTNKNNEVYILYKEVKLNS